MGNTRASDCGTGNSYGSHAFFVKSNANAESPAALNDIMSISSIERKGSYYELYDSRGKKYKSIHYSHGELLGWSDSFFIMRHGSYYDLYDEDGKKYKSIHHSYGEFVSFTGDTFILRHGSHLDTYDINGKKIASRHS